MILFAEDWSKYPSAQPDFTTRNRSFISLAAKYKSIGIKNHTFILALVNQSLKGIDPFDPNLTKEQEAAIAYECKINFWYFIREVARVPGRSGDDSVPLEANRGNIALFWLFFNHIATMLIQIRQTGKSLNSDMLMSYLLNIRCKGTHINLITKDDTLRAANLERLKDIISEYPDYLNQRQKSDIANSEEIKISRLKNSYRGHLPSLSPKQARKMGRGLTSGIFQIDEAAYLPNIAISLPAALSAGTNARDRARKNDEPYGTIITTTAGQLDDPDGKYVHNLLINSATWTERFFDAKNREELERIVTNASPGKVLRVNCTFSHRQLGYTDEWLRRAISEAMITGEEADRDFFNVWTSGSQSSPLPIQLTNTIRLSQIEPAYTELDPLTKYIVRWYIPEHQLNYALKTESVVVGIDPSDAAGGDDIGVVFTAVKTGAVVGSANINETNLIEFSKWLMSLMVKYPKLVAIIERKSSGAYIIDYLLKLLPSKGIDPFKRLFNLVVQNKDEQPDRFKEISRNTYMHSTGVYDFFKKSFGFATSFTGMASRSDLYSDTLLAAARNTGEAIRDKPLIDQLLALVKVNGRVDHQKGQHDDLVIGWLLCYWLLSKGKNLDYYGINAEEVLSTNRYLFSKNKLSDFDAHEQKKLKSELTVTMETLRSEKDPTFIALMETKLRSLNSQIQHQDSETVSVDAMINEIAKEKQLSYHNALTAQSGYYYGNYGGFSSLGTTSGFYR